MLLNIRKLIVHTQPLLLPSSLPSFLREGERKRERERERERMNESNRDFCAKQNEK